MGFWSSLFGKKKKVKYEIEDSDGQEQYFKTDFDESAKNSTPKQKKPSQTTSKKAEVGAVTESVNVTLEKKQSEEKKPSAPKKVAGKKPAQNVEAEKKEITEEKSPAPAESEANSKKTGRFEIKKAKDGRFVFNLYAPNHIIVATSQVYSTSSAAVNGIQSIIANAEKSPIEDNTLKNPTKQPYPKWEMYIDKGGEYRFRLYATNGNCVVHSQGYKQKSSCKNGIDSIIRCSKNAEIDKSYLKKE